MKTSVVIIIIGLALMSVSIYGDSEPGALPLLLVACGIAGFFISRARSRKRHP